MSSASVRVDHPPIGAEGVRPVHGKAARADERGAVEVLDALVEGEREEVFDEPAPLPDAPDPARHDAAADGVHGRIVEGGDDPLDGVRSERRIGVHGDHEFGPDGRKGVRLGAGFGPRVHRGPDDRRPERRRDLGRPVGRTVVDDDDLGRPEGLFGEAPERLGERRLLVIGGDDHRHRNGGRTEFGHGNIGQPGHDILGRRKSQSRTD